MLFCENNDLTSRKRCWLIIAAIVMLLSTTGCTEINRFLQEKVLGSPETLVYHQLDEAEQAMRDKRYEEAKRLYESILQTEQKASVIQEARYGLACIALLTASDLAQYRDGLHAMQAWAANSTREGISRDPRHLLPLLEKRVQTLEALHGCREANKECRKRNEDLRHKHNATLTNLRELRGERKELRQKIRELENLYNELLDTRKDL